MSRFWTLQAALIIRLCASAVDFSEKHVSCSDIQTQDGFQFKYDHLAGGEISVYHGKTLIGSWEKGIQTGNSSDVIWMDNNSVITKECRDIWIRVFTVNQDQGVSEHNFSIITTGNSYNPVTPGSQVNNTPFIQANTTEPVPLTPESQTAYHVGIGFGVFIGLSVIIGVPLYLYLSWKKKLSFLWLCNALKKRFSTEAESSEPGETRPLSVIEMQEILTTENQLNGISLENVVATDPSGSGENGGAQDNPCGSVHVVSVHPRCDASNSLDHIMANEEFQTTANGHLNNSDVDGASHHGDMNSVRNLRDDPGGSSGVVRLDIVDSDTEAEAEPLVNKGGQDQDRVRRCSATPEHDVESKTRVKNFGDY